jgi:hypothetical protein
MSTLPTVPPSTQRKRKKREDKEKAEQWMHNMLSKV